MSFTPLVRQKMPRSETAADAIATVAREWSDMPTAFLATRGKISKDKAANILKGHASGRTVAHVLYNIGTAFSIEVIELIVGESLDAHLAREAEGAKLRGQRIETTRARLAQSARRHADPGGGLRT